VRADYQIRVCEYCGKNIEMKNGITDYKMQRYCGRECYNKAKHAEYMKRINALPEKHCSACGKKLEPMKKESFEKFKSRRYCNDQCYRDAVMVNDGHRFRACPLCGEPAGLNRYCLNCASAIKKMKPTDKFLVAAKREWPNDPVAYVHAVNWKAAYRQGRLPEDVAIMVGVKTSEYECPVCGTLCRSQRLADRCCAVLRREGVL